MTLSGTCMLAPDPMPVTVRQPSLSFPPPRAIAAPPALRGMDATAVRERRLLLLLVAVAHIAGAIALARVDARTVPIPDTPITVALIQAAVAGPADTPSREAPPVAAVAPVPEVPAPPPPVEAPPEPSPPPALTPEPRPAPVARPDPPKPRTQPAPKRELSPPRPAPEPPPTTASATAAAPIAQSLVKAPVAAAHEASGAQPEPVTAARFDAAYLNNPPPAYPRLSRRMQEEGRVLLRVFVTADGRASRIELSESSGSSRLDGAAEKAVSGWRFLPARQGERNIDAWVVVPIVFRLEGY
ncbi:MAG TPA: energy transducer TonB [Rhodocyclaceae bacterium]|nr:energy transducer TonB [Rhodocyclaceae bacterium]HRQ48627.1 energy transducer TonB [Rhodocyclaceae bacterium]